MYVRSYEWSAFLSTRHCIALPGNTRHIQCDLDCLASLALLGMGLLISMYAVGASLIRRPSGENKRLKGRHFPNSGKELTNPVLQPWFAAQGGQPMWISEARCQL